MYNDSETLVSTRAGDTDYFHVSVGLHHGFALISLYSSWMYYLVICEHSREEVELQLERWRETFESHGLRVSRGKNRVRPTCHAQKRTKLSTSRKSK